MLFEFDWIDQARFPRSLFLDFDRYHVLITFSRINLASPMLFETTDVKRGDDLLMPPPCESYTRNVIATALRASK